MDVLQDKENEILIMLVEVYESQKDIEESVVDLSGTFAKTCYFLVIDDTVSGGIVVNLDGAINLDRELIDEVFLVLRKWIVLIQIDDGFWGIFAKNSFAFWRVFQQYLWQNKDAIVQLGIVIIPNIMDADIAFNVLHGVNAVQDILNQFSLILMFFYEDSHVILFYGFNSTSFCPR